MTNLEQESRITIGFLEGLADRLDTMVERSAGGGWSTHQSAEQTAIANDCRRHAAFLKKALP